MMTRENKVIAEVKKYYGEILKSSQDLKTNACCSAEILPPHLKKIVAQIHPEILEKFYGCGVPIPPLLEGRTVLDLGCGTGRDAYILSSLVGPHGKVYGVDMTSEQLEVARRHAAYHTEKFQFSEPNVEFRLGYMEDLVGLGIPEASIDVVVSNCVLNLSPDKEKVFSEIFRVLKPGGELYFSDVFSNRRVPEHLAQDPVLIGECLGGALYLEDFRRLLLKEGCRDYRIVTKTKLSLDNTDIERKAGFIDFQSMTVRAFKLDLEDRCEDFGQVATYLGTIPESPHFFDLDDHHRLEKKRPLPVCSNTAAMLLQTRLSPHFRVEGDLSTHFGLFDCGPSVAQSSSKGSVGSEGCC